MVSGASGDAGIGVLKSLSPLKSEVVTIGADSAALHGGMLYASENEVIPRVNSRNYLDSLIQILVDKSVDFYIPTIDSEIGLISEFRETIRSFSGAVVLTGPLESIKICEDKYSTASFLEELGLPFPATELADNRSKFSDLFLDYPVIVKPRRGNGSRGLIRYPSHKEVPESLGDNWIIQEDLGEYSREFTAGVLVLDDETRQVSFIRTLKNGSTATAQEFRSVELADMLRKVAESLGHGYWNIQGKILDSGPVIFEINPRFSGSSDIVSEYFNAPAIWLFNELGRTFDTKSSVGSGQIWVKVPTHHLLEKKPWG